MRPTERMPTAGKLISAIGLAALGWQATQTVKAIWPIEEDFGHFSLFTAVLGLLVGWWVMGNRIGRGYMAAIGAGLTGLGAFLFWEFLLLSFYEMIQRSLDLRYEGPVEAIQGMFEIAFEYAQNIYYWPLIGFLVLGAVVIALIAEVFTRRIS
ncbi:MAG: TrgA family protein [Roseovarius sp.]|uniref:TrgA family protein n=1 Tax=Alphaproteobacteria TaxID=28211 RepID=UPI0032EB6570